MFFLPPLHESDCITSVMCLFLLSQLRDCISITSGICFLHQLCDCVCITLVMCLCLYSSCITMFYYLSQVSVF